MSAFDNAWSLLKMPMVPNSLRRIDEKDGFGGTQYRADFKDPQTKIIHEMSGVHYPPEIFGRENESENFSVAIKENDPVFSDRIAFVNVNNHPMSIHTTGERRTVFHPEMAFVSPHARRKGYGTAMYDMMAAIIDREKNERLYPANIISDDASALWDMRAGGEWPNQMWPIRPNIWEEKEPRKKVLKADFSLPRTRVPSFFSPDVELAVHGSRIPSLQADIDTDYRTGEFGEAMKDGRYGIYDPVDQIYLMSGKNSDIGVESVYDEAERASLVRALMEAGIVTEDEIGRVLDEVFDDLGQYRRLRGGRGRMMASMRDA